MSVGAICAPAASINRTHRKGKNMKIQIVTNRARESAVFDSFAAVEAAGFKLMPPAAYESRLLRDELRGQPEIEGLCGPMWGGEEHPLRYEDWESYDLLSR